MNENLRLWLTAAVVVVLGTLLIVVLTTGRSAAPQTTVPETPTPVASPTATLNRHVSPLASQSAFLNLEEMSASLSSSLNSFTGSDPQLTPPKLDLPLGLQN